MTAPNIETGVIRRLAWVAEHHAGRTAIIDGKLQLTYAAMMDEVSVRAEALTAAGLRRAERVALVAENSADFLLTILAVWSAGGVPATIYPASGPRDLQHSLESARPALVLTDATRLSEVRVVAPPGVPVVALHAPFEVTTVFHDDTPEPAYRAPAFLICYSSGTTSRPKAITLSEEAVHNGAATYGEIWHLGPDDAAIVCLPMAWLFGLNTTAMATLFYGGTVISLKRSRPELVLDAITTHRATFITAVTTIYAKLAQHLDSLEDIPDLSTLRLCISGGEPRNETAFDRWTRYAGVPVHDNFCASECFPLITYDPIADPQPVRGSAGKLAPRSLMRVVGPNGEVVPPGQVGEAQSAGPGLMLGYWGDPEATTAALTDDGWYRTKDLVKVDQDGFVYVVGRLSDMIIRGGSNVSPSEVESTLREHPAVRDVAVLGLPDEVYGQEVVAAVLVTDAATFDQPAVRQWAADRLAAFKVPTRFVVVDELPVSATTGKVDRRALAASLPTAGVS